MKNQETVNAFGKLNYAILVIGLLLVIVGFVMMSGGAAKSPNEFNEKELFSATRITYAPIAVIAGYVVVILAIMLKPKNK